MFARSNLLRYARRDVRNFEKYFTPPEPKRKRGRPRKKARKARGKKVVDLTAEPKAAAPEKKNNVNFVI